jgi:hypothetical protein
MWWIHDGVFRMQSFDAKQWFAPLTKETEFGCYRGGMARDIKDRVLKPQMSRNDVMGVLGKPDGHSTEEQYQCILGMCSGFQMDYDVLHVYFDGLGRFTHARIMQH